jgi:hypothetical protein
MKQLAVGNNTAGATIYDLGTVLQSESIAELNNALKSTEKKANGIRQEEGAQQEKLKQMEIEARIKERQMQMDHEDMVQEKNIRKDLMVAEIRAAGFGAMQDINANQQSDYMDFLEKMNNTSEFQQSMNFDQLKETNRQTIATDKSQIAREKIAADMAKAQIALKIAQENKNKYDSKKKSTPKKK